MLLEGHPYFFVAHDYNTNYIFEEPIAGVKDVLAVELFDKVFIKLTEKGRKSRFNVRDNQATGLLKSYMTQHNCKWQFMEPSNHCINAT